MPVTVVVRSASASANAPAELDAPSLTFDGGRVLIGRGSGCDVRLPDPSVSFRHATIRATGSDFVILDEGSTNGTWVGGVKLLPQTPRIVKTGDLVRVGRVWLELVIGQKPATPDLGLATRDLAFALVQCAMDAVGDDTVARVRVVEGEDLGAELRLAEEGRAYVIGRAETCDLPLADQDASREHAIVVRRGAHVLLRDQGSHNGVFLGDQRLAPDRDTAWRPPTMARVGVTVLALDEPVATALAALEAADDEVMQAGDEPAELAPRSTAASAGAATTTAGGGDAPASAAPRSRVPQPGDDEGGAAPIAAIAAIEGDGTPLSESRVKRARREKKALTVTDVFVFALAVGLIGASIAGLVWVLR